MKMTLNEEIELLRNGKWFDKIGGTLPNDEHLNLGWAIGDVLDTLELLRMLQPKVETNADRIRAMSDEELAVFLDDLTCLCVDCNDHDGVNENCPIYKQGCGRYCEPKDLMDWLQQPAEEET